MRALDARLRDLPLTRPTAAVMSAVLMWLAFPPVNVGIVVFVAPIPLLWALRTVSTSRRGFAIGALFGSVFFALTLSWLGSLGVVAWIPAVLVLATGAAACGLAIAAARSYSAMRWWVAAVGWWALWEFARARIPFGGFPWASAGYPIGTIPGPRGAAQWIGATGWSVLVVAFAAGVIVWFTDSERRPLLAAASCVVGLGLLGAVFSPTAIGPEVRVTVIQGNSPCPRVHCEGEREAIYRSHLAMTQEVEAGSTDLVVWGENSFGGSFEPTLNNGVRDDMAAEAVRIDSYLLVSGTRSAGPDHFDNLNVVFDPQGTRIGEYLKRHPVPFGEYVPFKWLTRWVPQLERVPRDMTRGVGIVVFPIEAAGGSGRFGSVISFEGAFSRYLRAGVAAGAEMMVVPTNESSFDDGPASDQLLGMIRMSAASLGIDIVVAAITGKSAIVRADGTIVETTSLFEEATLDGTVALRQNGSTLYATVGDWLQWLSILALIVSVTRYRIATWWTVVTDEDTEP